MRQPILLSKQMRQSLKGELLVGPASAAMIALGIGMFSAPNHIVGGGVSGIATILYTLFGLPIGAVTFAMNLPLLLIGWRRIGRRFILRTLWMVALISVMLDAVGAFIAPYQGEPLLAALFGGALSGAGLGIVLMRGDSTGGTDIVVKLIKMRRPHFSFGKIVLVTDLAVVAAAAVVYRSLEAALYGAVMIYVSTEVIDRIIAGADARRMVLAVTQNKEAMTRRIIDELNRGVTVFDAMGGYSGSSVGVLLCVVENQQLFALKSCIWRTDPKAFVIVTQATEILGEGFKPMEIE